MAARRLREQRDGRADRARIRKGCCLLDIFSRKIVGWQVYDTESGALASEVMRDICLCENIAPQQVALHSDNGSTGSSTGTTMSIGTVPSAS